MSVLLETQQLTKNFGRIRAVHELNLHIAEGMVFGMLGPNGSGKTTTLGMLLGVTNPTSGSFSWFGEKTNHEARKKVGAILERPIFYPYMSARKNLEVVCLIKEISKSRIDEVLKTVGLLERKNDAFKTYSLGMKQRLAIASALLCDPRIMILDEPTNGLDPQGIADIRELIRHIASDGKTIVLASHLLDEVQKVCTDFCVLGKGKLLYTGNVKRDLESDHSFELEGESSDAIENALKDFPFIVSKEKAGEKWVVKTEERINAAELNKAFFEKGIVLSHLSSGHKSLEEKFLRILNENNAQAT
ncbi:MAG: ATP-binding cassette domain-containing protein [Flavobacteriales bacterium]|nr:ATP-binding cassette domain-containing protein [Flavobacteriales bacterium]